MFQCQPQLLTITLLSFTISTAHGDGHPWWQLDLGNEYWLGVIAVTLRTDCCGKISSFQRQSKETTKNNDLKVQLDSLFKVRSSHG